MSEERTEPLAEAVHLSPRAAALLILIVWDRTKKRYIESLLHEHLDSHRRARPDAAFMAQLCYGIVRHRSTLRILSEHFVSGDLRRYPRSLRMAISLGLFQLLYLRTPPHAAVSESVRMWDELMALRRIPVARRTKGRGLLNAVLRRASREIKFPAADAPREQTLDAPDTVPTMHGWVQVPGLRFPSRDVNLHEMLGLKYSHPPEMVRVWLSHMGEAAVLRLLDYDNRPPAIGIVLRDGDAESYCRRLAAAGFEGKPGPLPRTVIVPPNTAVTQLPGFESGEIYVQDPVARRLAEMMPRRAGVSLLDLCASPGGKLTALLERGGYRGVLACDVSDVKLARIAENLQRLRFDLAGIEVLVVPRDPALLKLPRSFDQIIVDAPCSNTGVLARRHEARWRLTPEHLHSLAQLQARLLKSAARHLNRGGELLYTTCSIEPVENTDNVHALLRASPELRLLEEVEYFPGGDEGGGDGGYGALLKRIG